MIVMKDYLSKKKLYEEAQLCFNSDRTDECVNILLDLSLKNFPPADAFIGYLYLCGSGVNKDEEKARKYFKKASKQSHYYAKAFLSRMDIREGNLIIKIWTIAKVLYYLPIAMLTALSNKPEHEIKTLFRL